MPRLSSLRAGLGAALSLALVSCGGTSEPPPPGDALCTVPAVAPVHEPGTASAAVVHKLEPALHPEALCNDGTPGFFVVRRGFGGGARRWVIYLEGGGHCGDAQECSARYQQRRSLMSSAAVRDGDPVVTELEGLKSVTPEENPDFYDANFVQVHYCSSDLWSGDRAATADAPLTSMAHWHFRGRAIFTAVVSELEQLGLADAEEVFLAGSSAGGVGVANLADDLRERLAPNQRLVALQDAGFIISYPRYDPATGKESDETPSPDETAFIATALAWGGRGAASCEQAATDDAARATCRIPGIALRAASVSVPMFVRQSQLDPVQLKRLIDPALTDPSASAFRDRFAAQMREWLAELPDEVSVFSTHDTEHGVMNTTAGWTQLSVDGVVLRDAVGRWYRDPCGTGAARRIAP